MKLHDIGINLVVQKLWVCDDDDTNMRQWRGSLKQYFNMCFLI
jgi:hypothetical protein